MTIKIPPICGRYSLRRYNCSRKEFEAVRLPGFEEFDEKRIVPRFNIAPSKCFRRARSMKTPAEIVLTTNVDYLRFVEDLKARISVARISAARVVNSELISLYWDIGRGIVEKQQILGWGDSVVEMVAADLRRAFPASRSFSSDNVWRMRQFYQTYSASALEHQPAQPAPVTGGGGGPSAFLGQVVPETHRGTESNTSATINQPLSLLKEVPWGQNLLILKKVPHPVARLWYLHATARFGWSRNVLLNQIKAGAYDRAVEEKKTHNFDHTLPEHLAEQADEMLKSSPSASSSARKRTTWKLNTPSERKRTRSASPPTACNQNWPGELKGKLPTAKQLAGIVRAEMGKAK